MWMYRRGSAQVCARQTAWIAVSGLGASIAMTTSLSLFRLRTVDHEQASRLSGMTQFAGYLSGGGAAHCWRSAAAGNSANFISGTPQAGHTLVKQLQTILPQTLMSAHSFYQRISKFAETVALLFWRRAGRPQVCKCLAHRPRKFLGLSTSAALRSRSMQLWDGYALRWDDRGSRRGLQEITSWSVVRLAV